MSLLYPDDQMREKQCRIEIIMVTMRERVKNWKEAGKYGLFFSVALTCLTLLAAVGFRIRRPGT